MKAISKREHKEITTALLKINELVQIGILPSLLENEPADGFLLHHQSLSERYRQYENLLEQLTNCIAAYEALYKEVRVNVVGPALRQARKKSDKDSTVPMASYLESGSN